MSWVRGHRARERETNTRRAGGREGSREAGRQGERERAKQQRQGQHHTSNDLPGGLCPSLPPLAPLFVSSLLPSSQPFPFPPPSSLPSSPPPSLLFTLCTCHLLFPLYLILAVDRGKRWQAVGPPANPTLRTDVSLWNQVRSNCIPGTYGM
eukprot:1354385-Rhodomonas_salina.1